LTDVKPENILLTERDGRADWVKMLDFGVARMIGEPPVTGHGQISGTAEFIAPELLIGDGTVTPAGDLYALGILFHDAIVGRPPFSGRLEVVLHQHLNATPPRLSERYNDPLIPTALDELVSQLLLKDPHLRPSAAETSRTLEHILTRFCDGTHQGASLHDAATRELPFAQRATQIVDTSERPTRILERPTQLIGRDAWPTQLLPQITTQVHAEDLDGASPEQYDANSLFREAVELADRICTGNWPTALKNLGSKVADCYKEEADLVDKLSLLQKLLAERAAASDQHQSLRQDILGLSEQLQMDGSLSEDARKDLLLVLEKKERAFFEAEARWQKIPPTSSDSLQRRIADVERERTRAQLLFVRLLCEMPTASSLAAKREALAQVLQEVDQKRRTGPRQ
jgi:serine/threonine protein kinase